MQFYINVLLASVFIAGGVSVANAGASSSKTPAFTIDAKQVEQTPGKPSSFKGNVVIKMGNTKIKTDSARVTTDKQKIIIYTDTFKITAETHSR